MAGNDVQVSIEDEFELRVWNVETTQGSRKFQTKLDEWPQKLPGGDLLIRDVAGDLYLVVSDKRLDPKSEKLLWAFLD